MSAQQMRPAIVHSRHSSNEPTKRIDCCLCPPYPSSGFEAQTGRSLFPARAVALLPAMVQPLTMFHTFFRLTPALHTYLLSFWFPLASSRFRSPRKSSGSVHSVPRRCRLSGSLTRYPMRSRGLSYNPAPRTLSFRLHLRHGGTWTRELCLWTS